MEWIGLGKNGSGPIFLKHGENATYEPSACERGYHSNLVMFLPVATVAGFLAASIERDVITPWSPGAGIGCGA